MELLHSDAHWQFARFLSLAEAGMWAFFIFNLGMCLMNFHEVPQILDRSNQDNNRRFMFTRYIKLSGLSLVVIAIIKLAAMLYVALS